MAKHAMRAGAATPAAPAPARVNTLPLPEILPFLTLYVLLAIIQIFSAILNLALRALLFSRTSASEAITGFLVIALNGFKEFP